MNEILNVPDKMSWGHHHIVVVERLDDKFDPEYEIRVQDEVAMKDNLRRSEGTSEEDKGWYQSLVHCLSNKKKDAFWSGSKKGTCFQSYEKSLLIILPSSSLVRLKGNKDEQVYCFETQL